MLIEPSVNAVRAPAMAATPKAPDVKADPAQYIAAARRAAHAAAQESASRTAEAASRTRGGAQGAGQAGAPSGGGLIAYVNARRRSLLLSVAGLVLALGAAQVARLSLTHSDSSLTQDTGVPPTVHAQVAPAPLQAPPGEARKPAASGQASASAPTKPSEPAKTMEASPVKGLPTLAMGPGNRTQARGDLSAGLGDGLRDLADAGNPAAEYEVGLRLVDGRGVTRDPKAAAGWFEKAARQGLAPAAYRLGSQFEKGIGVARDAAQSTDWYQRAADAGNIRAMHNLAVMLAEGVGGKSDYTKAAQWFAKASQMGVRDSQFNLAILYARGLGIEQSLSESYKWFAIAAAQGDADAAKKRDEVAARLDPKALASAKAAADGFQPITPLQAANDVLPPPGGWDAVPPSRTAAPASSSSRASVAARISRL